MAGASTHEPVKVVYINTRYVETDPLSFKSVVQSLTGKDSAVGWMEESSFAGQKRQKCGGSNGAGRGSGGGGVSILSNDFSTNDFDRLLLGSLELPPKWF